MNLCRKAGFEIKEVKCVNASGWEKDFDEADKKAKEILIVCQKSIELSGWKDQLSYMKQ